MPRFVRMISWAIFLVKGQGLHCQTGEALGPEMSGQLIETAPVARAVEHCVSRPAEIPVWRTQPRAVIMLSFENSYDLIPASVLALAGDIATRIYARLGLELQLRTGNAKRGDAKIDCSKRAIEIRVEFTRDIPNGLSDTTLASTLVYNIKESRIYVLANRIRLLHQYRPRLAGPLLGHVFAHEIAHALQNIDRHSESGIMRAHWTEVDHEKMRNGTLEFEPSDVALIHLGVESRFRSCSTQVQP